MFSRADDPTTRIAAIYTRFTRLELLIDQLHRDIQKLKLVVDDESRRQDTLLNPSITEDIKPQLARCEVLESEQAARIHGVMERLNALK
jgi:hypothetical protein